MTAATDAKPQILLNDFRRMWRDVADDAHAAFDRVGSSGWYILGTEVAAFEEKLAVFSKLPFAVGTGNGLDAIEIGLRVMGIGPGDRVITTPLSAFASTLAIVRAGATPVFVDTDRRGLIDLDLCRRAFLSKRAACLLPVHLYGIVMDLEALDHLRGELGVRVLEDCAQSIGGSWRGRAVGTASDIAATSFYPTKNLGALGDGGAILTASAGLAQKAKALRNYGESSKYVHDEVGMNSRLDELQAAILRSVFLTRLPSWMEQRRAVADAYISGIANRHVEVLQKNVEESVWHLFPVAVSGDRRAEFMRHLQAAGVLAGIHYPKLISDQAALRHGTFEVFGTLDNAARLCQSEVSLPIHPYLTSDEIAHVIDTVNRWEG